jgi:DNA-binding NtrC family response regulator
MKILVVDDDAIVLISCQRILELEGYEVTPASGAVEALALAGKQNYDLLLIDVKMPKHDGLFLLREVRKDCPNLPIVVMSGYPTNETISDVMKAGAIHFIAKPFKPDELMKLIRQALPH